MGQTQLLLLVLGAVLLSIAIVLGVRQFDQGMTNSNFDSLLQDAVAIASDVQAWKNTPQVLGGSPDNQKRNPADYTGATFTAIGYGADPLPRCYSNANGTFAITPTDFGLRITASNLSMQNRVVVLVRGTLDRQIVVQDGPLTSQKTVRGGYFVDSGGETRVFLPLECSGRTRSSTR
jgi:hypothetical protein